MEVIGIHDRGIYDLQNKKLNDVPSIIEIAVGIDRLFYSIIETNYEPGSKAEYIKALMKIPYSLAPIYYYICPLMDTKELTAFSRNLYDKLKKKHKCELKLHNSIGKRYYTNNIIGVPFTITVDHQSLEDGTFTLRDRDSTDQKRITEKDLFN